MDLASLRERLRNTNAAPEGRRDTPRAEPEVRRSEAEAPPELTRLDTTGLARMGWTAPGDILFLDTETTGLSGGVGTVAFLIGLARLQDGKLAVTQLFMPAYDAEEQLLRLLAEECRGCSSVVTFNGNTFDLPLLHTRCTMCRVPDPLADMQRMDLLPPSRRLWKRRLGSVRLTHLEEEILHLERENDVPGSEAPRRYFDFLRNGNMTPLEEIIAHNRQDVISMGELLCALCEAYAHPEMLHDRADRLSAGRILERTGERDSAETLYRSASEADSVSQLSFFTRKDIREDASLALDALLRRQGRTQERIELLQGMAHRKQAGAYPYTELAKIMEHTERDYPEALRMALEAQKREDTPETARRIARLTERIVGKGN